MELARFEQLLEQLNGQLDNEIEQRHGDAARFIYGQIAGVLILAFYLKIIDEEEHDRRFHALQDKFYDAF